MLKLKHITLRATAVLMLVSFLAPSAHAQFERLARKRKAPPRPVTFEIGGVYSGAFNGTISIDGVGYPISPSAQVYLIGNGPVPISMVPIGNHIYATGRGALGASPIEMLIARPVNDESRSGATAEITLRSPSAPQ